MIDHVTIENFRAIRSLRLRLSPLTAIVGPNASGKTSILRAIQGLDGNVVTSDFWRREQVRIVVTADIGTGVPWTLKWNSANPSPSRSPKDPPLRVQALRLDPARLASENQLQNQSELHPTGYNLANVFATLERDAQTEVAARFRELVDCFGDVRTLSSQPGAHRLIFRDRWSNSIWYEPSEVSEGSLLLLALLVLQHQDPSPDVILVEEPERGLHPYLLGKVIDMYRGLSEGRFGKPVQIVLATHSPEVLDHMRPEEVRFVRRNAHGDVEVEEAPVDEARWTKVYEEYQEAMGALWLSGGLGGVPGG